MELLTETTTSTGSADSTIFSVDSVSSFSFPPSDASSPSIYLNLDSYPSPSADSSPSDDDLVFSYIGKMLMEEEDDYGILGDQYKNLVAAAEQPFLDILSDANPTAVSADGSNESWIDSNGREYSGFSDGSNGGWAYDPIELQQLQVPPPQPQPQPPPPPSIEQLDMKAVASLMDESVLNSAFLKGMEEAKKFLPNTNLLGDGVGAQDVVSSPLSVPSALGRRKNSLVEDDYFDVVQGRSMKQSAIEAPEADDALIREMFDRMLRMGPQCFETVVQELKTGMQQEAKQISNGVNNKGRGRQRSREVVDLRTLLIHCAQAVSTDDWRSANELLKQIRQHSSSTGDATQRLAQCFADGLQARIMGTGSMLYHALVAKRTTAVDLLKAYKIYMAACPYKKISFFTSNHTILNIAKDAKKLHVIDFGIYYGFQWPCLLQRLSELPTKPSSVRITGIDNPEPGFRPEERLQVTGRRLQDYAKEFGISFKYKAIAAKWETITVEQLEIDPDEVVVVNALYQFKSLMDESVVADSPRDMVLSMIAKLKPKLFIHGVINGSYSAPFFVTRFREALFHCSAMFDMLDATVPRENDGRLVIERDLFGRGILNVVSCEGSERVERPETYKQWQVRNIRAGLQQVPLDREIIDQARKKVKAFYHKDFVVDVDHYWLLQGWKGRILYAISTWVPSEP